MTGAEHLIKAHLDGTFTRLDGFYAVTKRDAEPVAGVPAHVKAVRRGPVSARDAILTLASVDEQVFTLAQIAAAVSDICGVSVRDIKSERRVAPVMRARLVYYAVARELTGRSYPKIGAFVGGRDHATVLSGVRKVQKHAATYQGTIARVMALLEQTGAREVS